MVSKSIIRESGKLRRAELGDESRAEYDARIVKRCQDTLDWPDYSAVMLFLPIARQNEIDTWPLLRWIWREWPKIGVYVPRVHGDVMKAVRLEAHTPVRESDWGIPEPGTRRALQSGERLDLVLAPLLGFDAAGHRVGYGRGYYDRFFAEFPRARRVGLGYECLLVKEGIPAEGHDMTLGAVITEKRVHALGGV